MNKELYYKSIPKINLVNQKFGRLTVREYLGTRKTNWVSCWLCECECGKQKPVSYSALTSGATKSCGCIKNQCKSNHQSWKGHKDISLSFFHIIKKNAKKRKLKFDISINDIWNLYLKQNKKCNLSDLDISFGEAYHKNVTASVDRIDNSKGYTIDNIQLVHKDINRMRNKYDLKYFIDICKKVAKNAKN